jgi:hypothetical protein
MGNRPSDKDIERREREAEIAAAETHRALCVEAVTRWNGEMRKGRRPRHAPMIGVALEARFHFLDVYCPGCRQTKQIDLRELDRHPQTTLDNLIPSLSCRNCQPNPPFARLVTLAQRAWESPNKPFTVERRR